MPLRGIHIAKIDDPGKGQGGKGQGKVLKIGHIYPSLPIGKSGGFFHDHVGVSINLFVSICLLTISCVHNSSHMA